MTPFERRAAIAGLVVGAGSLGVATLQYAAPPAAPPAPVSTPGPPVNVNVNTAIPAPTAPSKLSRVLISDTLGRQINYIEDIVGPAESVSGSWKFYHVDGCLVRLNVDEEGTIRGLRLDISDICDFEWRNMYPNLSSLGSPKNNTIARFMEKAGLDYIQGCLALCGNAADPEIDFLRKGSHADNWVNLKVGFADDSLPEIAATNKLADAVTRNLGSDIADDIGSGCDIREKAWALASMSRIKIEYVEFGFDDSMSFKYQGDNECNFGMLEIMRS